jgi:LmeA-like phospholipid-binding
MAIGVPEPRRRRRWIGWLIALGVLGILVLTTLTLGEKLARDYARSYIHERLAAALQLPADHPMAISIGSGSLIGQLITGSIASVTAHVDKVSIGEFIGSVNFQAKQIPIDSSRPVKSLTLDVTLGQDNIPALRPYLSGVTLDSVVVKDKLITVGSALKVFGLSIPFSVALNPVARGGELLFEPDSITIGSATVSIADLRRGIFGGLANAILPPQGLCVAQYLPKPFALNTATIVGPNLVLHFSAHTIAFDDPVFSKPGVCAG